MSLSVLLRLHKKRGIHMATIKDIANKLGISISTVSKGLNGASDISEETRQQVLDTAVQLGYVLKKKKKVHTQKLCILVENIDYMNQFNYEIITGFRLAATEKNYDVSVMPINKDMPVYQSFERLMTQNNYKGAFFLGLSDDNLYTKQLLHTKIPTVLFNYKIENPFVGYIGTDYEEGIFFAIQKLYKLGHTRIALLNRKKDNLISRQIYNGFINAFTQLGLPVDHNFIKYGSCTPGLAKDYTATFLRYGVTAIVCASDLIASCVINEVHRLGKRVPEDISVIGFDDLPIAKYLAPPLCTIRQDRLAIGKGALNMLDSIINGNYVSTMLLHPHYIHRESITHII